MQIIDRSGQYIQDDYLIPLVIGNDGLINFLLKQINQNVEYHIEFEVFEVGEWSENKLSGVWNVPGDLELYLSGVIKWDGCSHISFGKLEEDGEQNGYLHLCGKSHWQKHCRVMNEIYSYAEKMIKNFDSNVAR